ncbi:MAG: hypothetical protein R3B70_21970 [Polyangiaceae bacterium]
MGRPTEEQLKEFREALEKLNGTVREVTRDVKVGSDARKLYDAAAKSWSDLLTSEVESGRVPVNKAKVAMYELRNALLEATRAKIQDGGGKLSLALSKFLKEDPPTLASLEQKYASKMFSKAFEDLSEVESSRVALKIIERGGKPDMFVTLGSRAFVNLGRVTVVLAYLSLAYRVSTSKTPERTLVRDGGSLVAGLVAFAQGAALAAPYCAATGPAAPVCDLAAGTIAALIASGAWEYINDYYFSTIGPAIVEGLQEMIYSPAGYLSTEESYKALNEGIRHTITSLHLCSQLVFRGAFRSCASDQTSADRERDRNPTTARHCSRQPPSRRASFFARRTCSGWLRLNATLCARERARMSHG